MLILCPSCEKKINVRNKKRLILCPHCGKKINVDTSDVVDVRI